jgi:hypothetical protein
MVNFALICSLPSTDLVNTFFTSGVSGHNSNHVIEIGDNLNSFMYCFWPILIFVAFLATENKHVLFLTVFF